MFLLVGIGIFFAIKPRQSFLSEQLVKPLLVKTQYKLSEDYLKYVNQNMVSGGPPKDGIPAIDNPKYVAVEEAEVLGYVEDDELVFGINYKGNVKAYPQSIMYWHEIVNEEFNGDKIAITYCPLTGSVIAYLGKNLGVSGKLYNSNLVMYDRETDSEIPQILGTEVNGLLKGENLEKVHVWVTTWKNWKLKHPDTLVLSRETGFAREYDRNPYPGYDTLLRVWFPVAAKSDTFESKKLVFGIDHQGEFLAVPKDEFSQQKNATVKLENSEIRLEWDSSLEVIRAFSEGKELVTTEMYWFAWYAYHPDTKVWNLGI